MLDNKLNEEWKLKFFEIYATEYDDKQKLEEADKYRFENFSPVVAKYFVDMTIDDLEKYCNSRLLVSKAKLSLNYHESILKVDYDKIVKTQLNALMNQQMEKLEEEDANFLGEDEKEIIYNSEFPFIKLMTLVYSKDTDEMTKEDQDQWKEYMNQYITQQIISVIINAYYTMRLYQDNMYTTAFQSPYNNEYVWKKYADNQKGLCLTYDFKDITEANAKELRKMYPVIYSATKLSADDIDYDVNNAICASMIKIDDDISQFDKNWKYITNHQYTEREYIMLDNLLGQVYIKTMDYPQIKALLDENYLTIEDNELEYDYQRLASQILEILSSDEFNDLIKDDFIDVQDITDNEMEIPFLKPEALYFGKNFPEEKLEEFKKIAEDNNVKVFLIKGNEETLYKSLI